MWFTIRRPAKSRARLWTLRANPTPSYSRPRAHLLNDCREMCAFVLGFPRYGILEVVKITISIIAVSFVLQICEIVNMCRNTVNNTWTLQWSSTDGMSRHTGDDSLYLCGAGGVHRPAALASSTKQTTTNSTCCPQCHQRTGIICQRCGTY